MSTENSLPQPEEDLQSLLEQRQRLRRDRDGAIVSGGGLAVIGGGFGIPTAALFLKEFFFTIPSTVDIAMGVLGLIGVGMATIGLEFLIETIGDQIQIRELNTRIRRLQPSE